MTPSRPTARPAAGRFLAPSRRRPVAQCGLAALCALALAGCATRAVDVKPAPANPAEFATWDCGRIHDEIDLVQQRAADVAWTVDERAGNNVVALGLGLAVFWPALLAMRPDGLEATELARLKGRYEALRSAAASRPCEPPGTELPAARAAALPFTVGDRFVYEERVAGRPAPGPSTLAVVALRRDEYEFQWSPSGAAAGTWRQDLAGNIVAAPRGTLVWQRLLRSDLELGQVIAGEIVVQGDAYTRARVRGQVVAAGPQVIAGGPFDVAVIELFGDAQRSADSTTRVEGSLVVDRRSGLVLRLDLRSAWAEFNLQRRLARIERGTPAR